MWKQISRLPGELGEVIVERNAEWDALRVTLIEYRGRYIETQTLSGEFTGPLIFQKALDFLAATPKH